jgi:hypothetical protein
VVARFIFPYTDTQNYKKRMTLLSIHPIHSSLPHTRKLDIHNNPVAQAIFIEKQVLATIV